MTCAITNVRVFDGETILSDQTVLIKDGIISAVGPSQSIDIPTGCPVVDGSGCTLLPGLIDAHTHTSEDSLKLALTFGVTTELEMGGQWTASQRRAIEEDDSSADLRTAMQHIAPKGGHPEQLIRKMLQSMPHNPEDDGHSHGPGMSVSTPEEAEALVAHCVDSGADYIKVMIENGHVLGDPGLPTLSDPTLKAGVAAAHAHHKMAIAHALTYDSTTQALDAGIDGLAHLLIDRAVDQKMIESFKSLHAFVTPCACLNASLMGLPSPLPDDERVTSRLPKVWLETLTARCNTFPQGKFQNVLDSIKALHEAGIEVLVGTDAAAPFPVFGGLAHGASVHHELQLFVEAGLSPVDALKAATSVPARRFGLDDRGRVAEGLRADLLLVEGDPTARIEDTLNIKAIWRRGCQLHD